MHQFPDLMMLLAVALVITALARRWELSEPLVLVLAGLALSFVPGVPDYAIDPELILVLVLPPLLYSAALTSSTIGLRANARPIGSLALGAVLVTTLAIGLVAWWLVPAMPLGAALVLGAVVAPPDAVAATSIGRRLGLPRRVMTVLSGESLVNDATALTAYRVAVATVLGTGYTLLAGVGVFLLATIGGLVVGWLVGWAVHRARRALADGVLESALGLLVPFAAYLLAEGINASGVLAVVVAGLYLGQRSPTGSASVRLQDRAVWLSADTLLEALVFALIGLQLRSVTEGVAGQLVPLVLVGTALTATVVLVRAAWVFATLQLPELLLRRGPAPPWRYGAVVSWAGMRGVVSLAAAAAIPQFTSTGAPFPQRPQVLFLAFFVTLGTLLLHGLTLPWVIRALGVRGGERYTDALAEAEAAHNAALAARRRLDELSADDPPPDEVAEHLRRSAERRSNRAWERLGRSAEEVGESPGAAYRRLRAEMLAAEREVFVRFRDEGRIDDVVLRRVLHELDLEDVMLQRE
ncbi:MULTISPECIES: Na+/H+ antiporter [unclassified Saccharopolyspora]|uniref:Na+/H+ antiporter n=1 Tax=unclassified Saccharopolyspora TaxID=2646250 RepID=UPI001CD6A88A|nr:MULTISPECIES: Na+/H+ antiporter [unclassified Saccharopolyspora]MCA1185988.1 Na+/H+ antiporter [Saccharopolyspora sp. 6T]MCA1192371.1 Na+/H+ antiporter [Saccharopolyspora sp. 6V]MCA1227957.1 Na+/H+ antiporter [Saccharopolyspora sp. 6M]